jgi:hypothetical protein
MDRKGKDNVQCIRAKTLPEVVEMPRVGGNVVPMRPRLAGTGHRGARVLQMPARKDEVGSLREGLRMTLVALFALLGWPPPTHGKDPGAGGLRPWKVERLSVISKLRIPTTGLAVQPAAYADGDVWARAA